MADKKASELREIRCHKCRKLLAKADMTEGIIEIKCTCGTLNKVEVKPRPPKIGTNG